MFDYDRSIDRQFGWMIRTKMETKSNKTNNCICVCTNRLLLVVLLASECMFFLTILYWNTSYIARTLKFIPVASIYSDHVAPEPEPCRSTQPPENDIRAQQPDEDFYVPV